MAANQSLSNYAEGGPIPHMNQTPACYLNDQIQYIPRRPEDSPLDLNYPTLWTEVPAGNSQVKHLYSPNLFDYTQMYNKQPIDTLYGHNYAQTYKTGLGRNKVIGGGHYKVFPLTNVNIRETHDYTDWYYPRPSDIYFSETLTSPTHLQTNYSKGI
jgi:hypothetical protein